MFEPGDYVQLTTTSLQFLADYHPAAFEAILDGSVDEVRVVEIKEGDVVLKTYGTFNVMLHMTCLKGAETQLISLVRKATSRDPAVTVAPEPSKQQDTAPAEVAGPSQQTAGVDPPANVKMAQWVMTEILSLKRYSINQALASHFDGEPDPTGHLQGLHQQGKEYRPIAVDLAPDEEFLYNSAMAVIRTWITKDVQNATIVNNPRPADTVSD